MDDCKHFWRAVDSTRSQCAKCGEITGEEREMGDLKIDSLKRYEILELALLARRLDPKYSAEEYIYLLEQFQIAVRVHEAELANKRLS